MVKKHENLPVAQVALYLYLGENGKRKSERFGAFSCIIWTQAYGEYGMVVRIQECTQYLEKIHH